MASPAKQAAAGGVSLNIVNVKQRKNISVY
jgi:hypothetical protein